MGVIRYDIFPSKVHKGDWCLLLSSDFPQIIYYGTWRECAEKLRVLHLQAKLMIARNNAVIAEVACSLDCSLSEVLQYAQESARVPLNATTYDT